MSRRPLLPPCWALLVAAAGMLTSPALGQGLVIIQPDRRLPPPPPRDTQLEIRYQRVYAEITDGVAVTTVKQTFRNPLDREVEGTYVFPLPEGAAVGDFAMTVNGKTLRGEVLDVDKARETYEAIVRQAQDPGLLELLDSRMYRARVFPIVPRGDVEVELRYSQTLPEQGGLGEFRHPLRSALPGDRKIGELVVHVKLRGQLPLSTIFSPSHTCDVQRDGDKAASVSYEQRDVRPDRDFQLYYQRQDAQFGLVVLTHRVAGEPGYFMLRLAPRVEQGAAVMPKDIAFVLDTSGSMSGGKLDQVKRAMKACLDGLSPADRFAVFTFSTDVRGFREGLVAATPELRAAAGKYVDDLQHSGGTNIHAALKAALAANPGDAERPYLVVFMTDGQPTVEVTDVDALLKQVADTNKRAVRFHVLGVGTDVNTRLLDRLAEDTRGTREYCVEGEDLELKLSGLVGRLAEPVLRELALRYDDLKASDVYPRRLPDLFRGTDLVVLGRYEGHGRREVRLDGQSVGGPVTLVYEGEFPENQPAADFLPRLWATRKVAYLLDELRLHGPNPELIDEVKRLAKRYQIVTPYTAALILEDTPLARAPGRGEQLREASLGIGGRPADVPGGPMAMGGLGGGRRDGGGDMRLYFSSQARAAGTGAPASVAAPRAAETGVSAVEASRVLADMKANVADADALADEEPIRTVGTRVFVRDGERWLDTTWDGKQETQRVTAFSPEYFELLKKDKTLARCLAIGKHVVVVVGDTIYEIVPPEEPSTQP
jgi:Ca-activated chloride channel family protein